MAKNKAKRPVKKKLASNVRLVWDKKDDKAAIRALQEIAEEFGLNTTEALRRFCVLGKDYAIGIAKEVKKLMKVS